MLLLFFFFAPSFFSTAPSAAEKKEARACALSTEGCLHGDRCPLKEAAMERTAFISGLGRSAVETGAKDAGRGRCFRCGEPVDGYDLARAKKAPFITTATDLPDAGAPLSIVETEQGSYEGPALPVIERPPASTTIV